MLTKELIGIIQSQPAGGLITDEARLDPKLALFAIDSARASLISSMYIKSGYIPEGVYSKTFLYIDKSVQEDECVLKYTLASPVVEIETFGYAFGYMGDGSSNSYTWIKSRNTLNSGSQLFKALISKGVSALYDPTFQMIELHYAKSIKPVNVQLEYIAMHPTALAEFNIDKDYYPITGYLWRMLLDYLRGTDMLTIIGRPTDKISNSTEDTTITDRK